MTRHTLEHTATILAKIAAVDRRIVGEVEIMAWHEVLNDLEPDDCLEAVAILRKETSDWLMPAHIRRVVADIEKRRTAAKRRALLESMTAPDGTPMVEPAKATKALKEAGLAQEQRPWWEN